MTKMLAVAFLVALLGACTSSNEGNEGGATVVGTVGGAAFVVADAIVAVTANSADIVVSSTPNACADVRDHIARPNSRVLIIGVDDQDPLTTGTYSTSGSDASRSALFESNVTDADCNVSYNPPPDGTGDGAVTLTSVSGTTVSGTFDVVLESGEHVTGTFTPEPCPELANAGSGSDTCTP